MGRGYLNVRATGGAVEPLPWRGLRGWGEGRSPLGRGLGDRKILFYDFAYTAYTSILSV